MESKIIGIIGGGQLGRMMAIEAKQMGHRIYVLDPQEDCPTSQVADKHYIANYDDIKELEKLCKACDVVTYEFENVPYIAIKELSSEYNIAGGYLPLYLAQNRYREKMAVETINVPTVRFRQILNEEQLDEAIQILGMPAVLKTCEGGYDGKGQVVIKDDISLEVAKKLIKEKECIIEEFLKFDKEISVVATRSKTGEITTLPIPENVHINNILHTSTVPCKISDSVKNKAIEYIKKIVDEHKVVGTLCVEFFIKGDEVYFNEMAPRPHNSGHYSIEGCNVSQFGQHIRAILGDKLGNTNLIQPAIMVNVLGQHVNGIEELVKSKDYYDCKVHMYGKKEAKKDRKMGHVTFTNKSQLEVEEIIQKYWNVK